MPDQILNHFNHSGGQTMYTQEEVKQIANTILQQLGGHKFVVMTGVKQLIADDVHENPALRMNLSRNATSANRLTISLMPDDTYTMEFYRQEIKKDWSVKRTEIEKREGVYCDMLQDIYTEVTGQYTYL